MHKGRRLRRGRVLLGWRSRARDGDGTAQAGKRKRKDELRRTGQEIYMRADVDGEGCAIQASRVGAADDEGQRGAHLRRAIGEDSRRKRE